MNPILTLTLGSITQHTMNLPPLVHPTSKATTHNVEIHRNPQVIVRNVGVQKNPLVTIHNDGIQGKP